MRWATQAPDAHIVLALRHLRGVMVPAVVSLIVSSCTMSALDMRNPGVDKTLVTHSISAAPAQKPQTTLPTGADAVAAALGGALAEGTPVTPLAWGDPESDVRGHVTHFAVADGACNDFITTRESFDGVSLYEGRLCRDGAGWQTHAFAPL